MSAPPQPAAKSSANSTAEKVGKAVGQGFREVSDFAKANDLSGKALKGAAKVGEKYEKVTNRDAKSDGRVLGILGAAGTAVVVGSTVIGAASQILVAGALAAGGAIGAAAYCKHNGHEKEYNTIVGGATTAGKTIVETSKAFAKGVAAGSKSKVPVQGRKGSGADDCSAANFAAVCHGVDIF